MATSSKLSPTRNLMPISTSYTTLSEYDDKCRIPAVFDRRKCMKSLVSMTAIAVAIGAVSAQAQQVNVKIGVMSDMSSLYTDLAGAGSTAAAKLAIAYFIKYNPTV